MADSSADIKPGPILERQVIVSALKVLLLAYINAFMGIDMTLKLSRRMKARRTH